MRLVAVGRDRDMLQRHRHLGCGDIAQLVKHTEKLLVAGRKTDPHARQVRALRQRLKRHDVCKVRPGALQHAARSGLRVNFRIAFVAQDQEAEAIGEPLQAAEIFA